MTELEQWITSGWWIALIAIPITALWAWEEGHYPHAKGDARYRAQTRRRHR